MHLLHSAAILHLPSWLQVLFSGVLEAHDKQEMPPKGYSDQTCGIPEIVPQVLPLLVSLHRHTAPKAEQRTIIFIQPPLSPLPLDVNGYDQDQPPVQVALGFYAMDGIKHRPLPQLQFS